MNELTAWLTEMAADPWAMEPTRLNALFARLAETAQRPVLNLTALKVEATQPKLQVDGDGVATIPIKGVLTKTPLPSWLSLFGIEGTSYGEIRRMLAEALESPAVERIELAIESPGGQVAGNQETAEAIAAATKPVTAVVEDLAASAAYWLAAQAETITANVNAFVGSIGVYVVYTDFSGAAEKMGATVHVIRSGEHKGMGVLGAPITEAQIAAMQENIDAIAGHFIDAVASGRGMERAEVATLATGRLWEAEAAVTVKLIDGVRRGETATPNQSQTKITGEIVMEQETEKKAETPTVDAEQVKAAERDRLEELRAAFPKDPDFAMEQFAAGASLTEAKAAYSDVLQGRLDAAEKEKAEAATKTVDGADATIGATAAEGNQGADGDDDGRDFLAVARAYAVEHGCTMAVAMQAVRTKDRSLHERFLARCRDQAHPTGEKLERVAG